VNLDLSQNRLTSSIPSECAALTTLTMWDVEDNVAMDSCNPLSPMVPQDLDNTAIGGPCPGAPSPNWPCTNTIDSDAAYTACVAAPASCTDLSLASLSLSCTIPTEIGLLTALTNLDLGANNLTGPLPTELGLLTNVLDLIADDQCLSGTVPTELGAMAAMTNIDMEAACLIGPVPSEMGVLTQLVNLDLSQNTLTSSIPTELGALTVMTMFDVEDNQAMNECNPLAPTVNFDIGNTAIDDACPVPHPCDGSRAVDGQLGWTECMADPAACTHLDLSGGLGKGKKWCGLTGCIPTEIGLLTALEYFNVEQNHLSCCIPSELGLLTALTTLNLGENDFTCEVPSELGELEELEELVIQCNDLSGALPEELSNLDELTRLDASCNVNVCGCVPGDLADDMSYNSYEAYLGTNLGHDCGEQKIERPKQCITPRGPGGRKCAARWNEGPSGGSGSGNDDDGAGANGDYDGDDWMYVHPRTLLPWSCEGIVTHFPSLVPPVNRSMHLFDKSQPDIADWLSAALPGNKQSGTGPNGAVSALAVEGSECDEGTTQEATMIVTPPQGEMTGADGVEGAGDPDAACAQYFSSTQSSGDKHRWAAARFTVQEFPCQQAAVAQAVTASVGSDKQVMTGVRTQSGGCMATQAVDGDLVWAEVDCAQGLPIVCRMDNPDGDQLDADSAAAAAGVDGGATQALFLMACMAAVATVGAVGYRSRRAAINAALTSSDEKLKLITPQGGHASYDSTQTGVHVYEGAPSHQGYAQV